MSAEGLAKPELQFKTMTRPKHPKHSTSGAPLLPHPDSPAGSAVVRASSQARVRSPGEPRSEGARLRLTSPTKTGDAEDGRRHRPCSRTPRSSGRRRGRWEPVGWGGSLLCQETGSSREAFQKPRLRRHCCWGSWWHFKETWFSQGHALLVRASELMGTGGDFRGGTSRADL